VNKVILYCLILLLFISCANNQSSSKVIIQLDEHLQQLNLQNLKGDSINIESFLGKPLLINYWATWCRYCKIDFPVLQEFKNQQAKNVNVISISDEPLSKIKTYQAKSSLDFTFLKQQGSLSKLGVSQRPTYALFDASGQHLETINGGIDYEILNELIEYHLKSN